MKTTMLTVAVVALVTLTAREEERAVVLAALRVLAALLAVVSLGMMIFVSMLTAASSLRLPRAAVAPPLCAAGACSRRRLMVSCTSFTDSPGVPRNSLTLVWKVVWAALSKAPTTSSVNVRSSTGLNEPPGVAGEGGGGEGGGGEGGGGTGGGTGGGEGGGGEGGGEGGGDGGGGDGGTSGGAGGGGGGILSIHRREPLQSSLGWVLLRTTAEAGQVALALTLSETTLSQPYRTLLIQTTWPALMVPALSELKIWKRSR